jgi:maleylpyruvate isomerase
MKLHGFWRSSATWRVRIALNFKGLGYEYVPIHLTRDGGDQHKDAFKQLNPMKHVPVLTITRDGKTHHVAESLAIIDLLEELVPTPALLPGDMFARARARQLALMIASGIQPLINTKIRAYLANDLRQDGNAWCKHWLTLGLAAVETLLPESAGRFSVGDEPSVADVCLVPQLYMARVMNVDLSPFPTILGIEAACATLPAFQRAEPHFQPDAEVSA